MINNSSQDRIAARAKVTEAKARKLARKQAEFSTNNPGLVDELRKLMSWNSFANSLMQTYSRYGAMSDDQTAAAWNMIYKLEEKDREKAKVLATAKSQPVPVPTTDYSRIKQMFDAAVVAGLKWPKFRAGELTLKLAGSLSRNPGAIYVEFNGAYCGKIQDNRLVAGREAPGNLEELLRPIAEDPLKAAQLHGVQTGRCSCCGAELTNKESVALGIGPICRGKWGF